MTARATTHTWAGMAAVGLWSTNAFTAQFVLERTQVAWLLLIESATAAVVLTGMRSIERRAVSDLGKNSPVRLSRRAVVIAVAGLTGTMTLQYSAYALAPVVAANALTYVWPLAAAGWFALRLRDRSSWIRGGLATIGFLGVVMTATGSAGGAGGHGGSHPVWGSACALGSAACMAVFTLGSNESGARRALIPAAVVTAAIAVVWIVVSARIEGPAASVWVVAMFMGAGQMAAGYRLWGYAMSDGGARRLAGLGYATPFVSTALLLSMGSRVSGSVLVGVGLILIGSLGVLIANITSRHRLWRRSFNRLPGHRAEQGRSPRSLV